MTEPILLHNREMKSHNMSRGSTLTVVELIIAILLLIVLLIMIVGYRMSRSTAGVVTTTQQTATTGTTATTATETTTNEVAWVPQTTKKTTVKKKTATKAVVTPKKTATAVVATKPKLTQTAPVTLQATPEVEVTHTNAAGDAETPLEADCAKVLVVTKPHALQSVGGVGSSITVAGSFQNCNWIPTRMPTLYVTVTDSLAGFSNNIIVPRQQVTLPGSLTTQVYNFSKTMQLTRQPANTTGYVMFTGADSIGNPIRNVIIPITFK